MYICRFTTSETLTCENFLNSSGNFFFHIKGVSFKSKPAQKTRPSALKINTLQSKFIIKWSRIPWKSSINWSDIAFKSFGLFNERIPIPSSCNSNLIVSKL